MSDKKPLMPKATAVWLVDNTSLTFEQIAEFCGLHTLEVKGIADGDVAQGIKGMDPITSGQLTRDEIKKGEADQSFQLRLADPKVEIPKIATKKRGPRYTPVSRRQDRPNAILWLLRNHAELRDAQISRLVGTTKQTISQVRERTHWNMPNLQPQDPVTLGLCTQIDLDAEVQKAAKRAEREMKKKGITPEKGGTLLPADETTAAEAEPDPKPTEEEKQKIEAEEDARVLEKLQQLTNPEESEASETSSEHAQSDEKEQS